MDIGCDTIMEYIYIGFSTPKKFKIGAKLIQLWQNNNFSHTYIRFESETMPSTVYHAAHGMVHFKEYCNFKKENHIICEFKIPVESKKDCLIDCIKRAGDKYSYIELLKIFMYDLALNFNLKLNIKDSSGYICSELVGNVVTNHLGIVFNKPYFLLTPKDIYLKIKDFKLPF